MLPSSPPPASSSLPPLLPLSCPLPYCSLPHLPSPVLPYICPQCTAVECRLWSAVEVDQQHSRRKPRSHAWGRAWGQTKEDWAYRGTIHHITSKMERHYFIDAIQCKATGSKKQILMLKVNYINRKVAPFD